MAFDKPKSKYSCKRILSSEQGSAKKAQHKEKESHEHSGKASNYQNVPRPWLDKLGGTNPNTPMPSANFTPSPMIDVETPPRTILLQPEIPTFNATKYYSPLSNWEEELPCSQPFNNLLAVRVPRVDQALPKSETSVECDVDSWSMAYYDPLNQEWTQS